MANKIVLKKSSVAAKVPVAGDLDFGELAINYTDGKLYFKKADNTIDAFTTAAASAPVTSVGGNIGDITDAQLLASIKNVDGTGSGLDADTLDGNHASAFYLASNPNGYTSNTGTVTSVGATAPLVSSGGTAPSISIPAANSTTNGYMSSAYASKLDGIAAGATANTGTVTSVSGTGSYGGLTLSGTVTGSGSLTLGGTPTGTWPISVSGNANTANNADTVDNYHASSLWRSDGGVWNPSANITLGQTANGQEWSFDIIRNGYTGGYWHVWDSSHGTMLGVDATNNYVYATGSSRAPIFYDSNNTGYYVDPNSTTYIYYLQSATTVRADSDRRLKDNIKPIENALEKVRKLQGCTYTRKDMVDKTKVYMGMIAQDVLPIVPEVVGGSEEGKYSLGYAEMVPLLNEAIKEQDLIILQQEARIAKLEGLVNKLIG